MADKEPPMRNSTFMQTRTAVIGIVAGFVLGSAGAATAAVAGGLHHHRHTCALTAAQGHRTLTALHYIDGDGKHVQDLVAQYGVRREAGTSYAALQEMRYQAQVVLAQYDPKSLCR